MRYCATSVFVLMNVGLAACGGGGAAGGGSTGGSSGTGSFSGGYSDSVNVNFTPIATPGSFENAEYFRSGALGQVNASSIYSVGGTGNGTLVAVVDTGIDTDHSQLINRIHPASTNIATGNPAEVEDGSYHGTLVAGLVAAERDGSGMHGLAFDAEILAIRADTPGSCATLCSFSQANLALATNYAVAQGADVINFSLGGATALTSGYRQALGDAADAGAVLVLAAGNDGDSEPTYPGRFAAEAAADGRAIVVGAVDAGNNIAGFSNRAGSAKNAFIVAPGVSIESTHPSGGTGVASGTSLAAPIVSGAAAALMEAAPSLTPEQVVQLLLMTATDLGDPGIDAIYGWGLLNLAEAISPQGTLTIPTSSTVAGSAVAAGGSTLALGGALSGAVVPASDVMMLDDFQRAYVTSLGEFAIKADPALDLADFIARRDHEAGMMTLHDGRMGLSAYDIHGDNRQLRLDHDFADQLTFSAFIDDRGRLGEIGQGADLDLINGHASGHAFSQFATGAGLGIERHLGEGYSLSLTAAGGDDSGANPASRLLAAGVKLPVGDGFELGIRAGQLQQDDALLGSKGQGAFAMDGWQSTRFAELSMQADISERAQLFLRAALGRSEGQDADPAQPVALDDFWSSSWALGWQGRDLLAKADRLTLALSQPLRAENAGVTTDLPVARTLEGEVVREKRHGQLSEQGREIDLELAYRRQLDAHQTVGVNVMLRHEPGHDQSADAEWIGVASYRLRF